MYKQIPYNATIRKGYKATSIADLQLRIFESYSTDYLKEICSKGVEYLIEHKNESRSIARRSDILEFLDAQNIKLFFESANASQLYFLAGNPNVLNIIGEQAAHKFLNCSYNIRKRLAKNAALSLVVRHFGDKDNNLITRLLEDKSPKVVAALYSNKSAIMLIPKNMILHTMVHGPIQSKIAIAANPSTPLILSKAEIVNYILSAKETDVRLAAAKNSSLVIKANTDVNILLDDKYSVIMALLSEKNNAYYLNPIKLRKLLSNYRKNPELKHLVYRALQHTTNYPLRR